VIETEWNSNRLKLYETIQRTDNKWLFVNDSQASYKGDHKLLGYQPFEEGEGRDVNNDN